MKHTGPMTTPPPSEGPPHPDFEPLAHARKPEFPVFLFLASVITRICGWLTTSIWYDEAISLWRSRLPMARLLKDSSELQGINLWEIILRPFSFSLWTLRLPALILSILSVYFAWRIMIRLKFKQGQITIAMIALATLPGLLWISQDARYYAPIGFFFLVAIWAGLEGKFGLLLGYSSILIFLHPTAGAWAVAAYLVTLLNGTRLRTIWWHVPVLGIVSAIKILGVLTAQVDKFFWLQRSDPLYLTLQTLLAFYADTLDGWGAILGLAMIAAVLLPALKLALDNNLRILYAGVLTPILIMILFGIIYTPVLFYRTMQPVLPLFCVLAGYVLAPSRRWYTWILPVAAALTLTLALANWNPATRGGGIEQIAKFIQRSWQPGDVLYYGTGTVAMPFDYYLDDYPNYMLDGYDNLNISWPGIPFEQLPMEQLEASRIWLIYPMEPTMNPEDADRLEQYSQGGTQIYLTATIHFAPIAVYLVEP